MDSGNYCTFGYVCDTSVNPSICKQGCLTNSNCPASSPICDITTHLCRKQNCGDNGSGCNLGNYCDTSQNPPVCIVGCLINSNCPPSTPVCDTITKQCKIQNCGNRVNECPLDNYCDTSGNSFVCKPGCLINANCPADKPVCESTTRLCRTASCLDTGNACSTGYICDIVAIPPTCKQGCLTNANCPMSSPYCDTKTRLCRTGNCLDSANYCGAGYYCDTTNGNPVCRLSSCSNCISPQNWCDTSSGIPICKPTACAACTSNQICNVLTLTC